MTRIPNSIHNSIYFPKRKKFKSKLIDFEILNNLNLIKLINKIFLIKLLDKMPRQTSLFETALITTMMFSTYVFKK